MPAVIFMDDEQRTKLLEQHLANNAGSFTMFSKHWLISLGITQADMDEVELKFQIDGVGREAGKVEHANPEDELYHANPEDELCE